MKTTYGYLVGVDWEEIEAEYRRARKLIEAFPMLVKRWEQFLSVDFRDCLEQVLEDPKNYFRGTVCVTVETGYNGIQYRLYEDSIEITDTAYIKMRAAKIPEDRIREMFTYVINPYRDEVGLTAEEILLYAHCSDSGKTIVERQA